MGRYIRLFLAIISFLFLGAEMFFNITSDVGVNPRIGDRPLNIINRSQDGKITYKEINFKNDIISDSMTFRSSGVRNFSYYDNSAIQYFLEKDTYDYINVIITKEAFNSKKDDDLLLMTMPTIENVKEGIANYYYLDKPSILQDYKEVVRNIYIRYDRRRGQTPMSFAVLTRKNKDYNVKIDSKYDIYTNGSSGELFLEVNDKYDKAKNELSVGELSKLMYYEDIGLYLNNIRGYKINDEIRVSDKLCELKYDKSKEETTLIFKDDNMEYPLEFHGDLRNDFKIGQDVKLKFRVVEHKFGEILDFLNDKEATIDKYLYK